MSTLQTTTVLDKIRSRGNAVARALAAQLGITLPEEKSPEHFIKG